MNQPKLTKRVVKSAIKRTHRYFLWDPELRGFGVKIEGSGTRTYVLRYRPKGLGRRAPKRFITIGRHGVLTAEQARFRRKSFWERLRRGRSRRTDQFAKGGIDT